jgi:thiamine-monophosphate kinase
MTNSRTANKKMGRVAPDPAQRGEFDLIARLLAPLTGGDDRALGLLDDAAVIPQKSGVDTVISTDTLVAGVHFLMIEPADVIARRLLRVNLSDIAAMGAEPFAYFLNLSLPTGLGDDWLETFVAGLQTDQQAFGVNLLGGDTTRTPGPLALSVTIFGEAPTGHTVCRSTARSGDLVFVSGTIGDAGLGLPRLRDGAGAGDPLVKRFQLPDPRVSLGISLRDIASAMADVSDGLLADLGHICAASAVGATIELAAVPVSDAARSAIGDDENDNLGLLTSGDDYELVFTVPPERSDAARKAAGAADTPITEIGRLEGGDGGVTVRGGDGRNITPEKTGYRHF